MAATIIAYWPGITDEQIDGQPGFWNDYQAFAGWIAEMSEEPNAIQVLDNLGVAPVLTYTTEGMDDSDVQWVAPRELQEAARRLREAVRRGGPDVDVLLEVYERNANGVDPLAEEFARDLEDVEAHAGWAEEQGASRMTLEVNW